MATLLRFLSIAWIFCVSFVLADTNKQMDISDLFFSAEDGKSHTMTTAVAGFQATSSGRIITRVQVNFLSTSCNSTSTITLINGNSITTGTYAIPSGVLYLNGTSAYKIVGLSGYNTGVHNSIQAVTVAVGSQTGTLLAPTGLIQDSTSWTGDSVGKGPSILSTGPWAVYGCFTVTCSKTSETCTSAYGSVPVGGYTP